MSNAVIQIEGFIANELGVRDAGQHRVVDVSVPHTPQKKNEQGQWEDSGPTTWYRASFWDEHGDAVLGQAQKGSPVNITGGLVAKTYAKNDGSTGVNLEVVNPTIAVVVRRPKRGQQASYGAQGAATEEPWAPSTPAASTGAGDARNTPGSYNDETPF